MLRYHSGIRTTDFDIICHKIHNKIPLTIFQSLNQLKVIVCYEAEFVLLWVQAKHLLCNHTGSYICNNYAVYTAKLWLFLLNNLELYEKLNYNPLPFNSIIRTLILNHYFMWAKPLNKIHPFFTEIKLLKIPQKLRVTQIWVAFILCSFDRRHFIGSARNKTVLAIVQSKSHFVCNFWFVLSSVNIHCKFLMWFKWSCLTFSVTKWFKWLHRYNWAKAESEAFELLMLEEIIRSKCYQRATELTT